MARAAEGTLEHVTDFLDATHPHADARPTHKDTGSLSRTMLLILNHTLPKYTPKLLDSVEVRICGDGGANRLYDMAPYIMSDVDKDVARRWYKPDVLIGDLDSVRKEVQGFYRDAGTLLEDKSGDVDTNDMHKCMTYIDKNLVKGDSNVTVLVVGALGGRLDHEMGNLHVLFQFPHLRVVLLDDLNLVTLLMPGSHLIRPNRHVEGPTCGLVPLGSACAALTTTGLRWNLDNAPLEFGKLVSTSNEIVADEVTVNTSHPLLWMTVLRDQRGRIEPYEPYV